MKAGTTGHPKFRILKSELKVPEYVATGILESLWNLTAKWKEHGGIGEWTNQEIAAAMEYDGDADRLIEILTKTGWLDIDAERRLVVHDWADHMPKYVEDRLRKRGKVAEGSGKSATVAEGSGKSPPTLPYPTLPSPASPPSPGASVADEKGGDEIWGAITKHFFSEGVKGPDENRVEKIVRALKAHGATAREIDLRLSRMKAKWPKLIITPAALVKHWALFPYAASDSGCGVALGVWK